jgi:hypothetical protein
MEAIWRNIGKFTTYIGKVLLPVLLSSLVFGGILAKYNNEMNLNKSILESAYQPMKQQYRECNRAQYCFHVQLNLYRASVAGMQESIQSGGAPPAAFWRNVTSLGELEETWVNVMQCYGAFTSLLVDVSLMLGEDGLDLTKVVERRNERLDSLIGRRNEIFEKLYPLELDGLFAGVRESSVDKIIKRREQEWVGRLKIAMSALKELNQMVIDAAAGQNDDFDDSDAIAAKALRKRFKTGPFEFLTRLTR